jgi:N-acetylmuramoyl-L-alanine amidase
MKRLLYTAIVLLLVLSCNSVAWAQKSGKITTVVIDAGHGGKDPGAIGRYSKEKDIVLKIALKTGQYIEEYLKDVKVIYTRKTDRFVELYKRAEIANKNNADVFISIHCNAINSSGTYGSESYVMGLHKENANLNVAMMENAAILLEENEDDYYEGFDVNAPESYISLALKKDNFMEQSLIIADNVQKQFKNRVGRKDRGVKQAGFLVLWRTTMPGVLVELGFLSNPTEEKFLNSEQGQVYMASAIYRAFKEYKLVYEKENAVLEVSKPGPDSKVNFRIQFYTSPKQLPLDDRKFSGIKNVGSYYHNGLYKYTSGHYNTSMDAEHNLKEIKSKGFNDAFIVAFYKNERISVSEAERLISED